MPYNRKTFDKKIIYNDEIIGNMQKTISEYSGETQTVNHSTYNIWKLCTNTLLFIIALFWCVINFYLIFNNALPDNPSQEYFKTNIIMIVFKILILGELNAFILFIYVKLFEKHDNNIVIGVLTLIEFSLVDVIINIIH
ncbi:hypothetical protein [Apilactobacillus timberlakei]|uniref:hypothetical protein n=1 Tax=Apilactobacillus timberlakei TaxID=2008380 RepID=UPI00112E8F84|nr:hypothetical protein [Apilactobacillus timberlakei]